MLQTKTSTSPQFYLFLKGSQRGPYELEEVLRFLKSGRIQVFTPVWKTGASGWQALHQVIDQSPEEILSLIDPTAEVSSKDQAKTQTVKSLDQSPPPLPEIKPSDETIQPQAKKTNKSKTRKNFFSPKLIISAGFLVTLSALALVFFSQNNIRPSRPALMSESDYQRLIQVMDTNPELAVQVDTAFSEKGTQLYLASNFPTNAKLSIFLESMPGGVLSEQSIQLSSEGLYLDQLATFKDFNFLQSDKIRPGFYRLNITSVKPFEDQANTANKLFLKKFNFEKIIYWPYGGIDEASFLVKLEKYTKFLRDRYSLHFDELLQNYITVQGFLNQLEFLFLSNLDHASKGKDLGEFEAEYHQTIGPLLYPLMNMNHQKMERVPDENQRLQKHYQEFGHSLKEFGRLSSELIQEKRHQKITPAFRQNLINQTKTKIEAVRDRINKNAKTIETELNSLRLTPVWSQRRSS